MKEFWYKFCCAFKTGELEFVNCKDGEVDEVYPDYGDGFFEPIGYEESAVTLKGRERIDPKTGVLYYAFMFTDDHGQDGISVDVAIYTEEEDPILYMPVARNIAWDKIKKYFELIRISYKLETGEEF